MLLKFILNELVHEQQIFNNLFGWGILNWYLFYYLFVFSNREVYKIRVYYRIKIVFMDRYISKCIEVLLKS
jgi:hypothetical protein